MSPAKLLEMRPQLKRTSGTALVVLALAGALPAFRGCGGEGDKTAASGADVAAFVEVLVPAIGAGGCPMLSHAAQEFQKNTREDIQLQREAKEFQRVVDAAPDEIQGDLQTFADAYSKWAKALAKVEALKDADLANPTPETIQELQGISVGFDRRELAQATHNVVAWMDENCGRRA